MKIKTKQKLNLPELIQYVWENDIGSQSFESKFGVEVIFGENRAVLMNHFVGKDDTFTVEVEDIVTPTTRFDELTEYIYDFNDDHHFTAEHKGANISLIIDCETHQFKTQAIYCKDTLIWSKEQGIPETGVLEVSE